MVGTQPTLRDCLRIDETVMVGYAFAQPTRPVIPVYAGMTGRVQQYAAGGLGVSPNSLCLPPRVGVRGLMKRGDSFLAPSHV